MKLIIELEAEYLNDEFDAEVFLEEANHSGAVLTLQVGRSLSEEEPYIVRQFQLQSDEALCRRHAWLGSVNEKGKGCVLCASVVEGK